MGVTLKGVKITLEVESIDYNTEEGIAKSLGDQLADIWGELEKINETINSKLS